MTARLAATHVRGMGAHDGQHRPFTTTKGTTMTNYDRERGTMVNVVDVQKLEGMLRNVLAAMYGASTDELQEWHISGDVCAYRDKTVDAPHDRNLVFVCTEGVGISAGSDGRITFTMYQPGGMFGVAVDLSPTMALQAVTDQQIDLADHVRVFGARLESNFSINRGRVGEWAA